MPYDEALADRIRDLLTGTPLVTEKKMFGGLGFMIGGHMAVGAHSDGGLIVRAEKEASVALAEEPGARLMERGGKGMRGWIVVEPDAVEDDAHLERWVHRGRDHARSRPPK